MGGVLSVETVSVEAVENTGAVVISIVPGWADRRGPFSAVGKGLLGIPPRGVEGERTIGVFWSKALRKGNLIDTLVPLPNSDDMLI